MSIRILVNLTFNKLLSTYLQYNKVNGPCTEDVLPFLSPHVHFSDKRLYLSLQIEKNSSLVNFYVPFRTPSSPIR